MSKNFGSFNIKSKHDGNVFRPQSVIPYSTNANEKFDILQSTFNRQAKLLSMYSVHVYDLLMNKI